MPKDEDVNGRVNVGLVVGFIGALITAVSCAKLVFP